MDSLRNIARLQREDARDHAVIMGDRLASEAVRLQAVESYDVLDASASAQLGELVGLAAHALETKVALIAMVGAERVFVRARLGCTWTDAPRKGSLISKAIEADEVLVVPDAAADPRFAADALIANEPRARFFAAAPLVTPRRSAIGALCVLDPQPHRLSADRITALAMLGRQAMRVLETERSARVRELVIAALDRELRDQVDSLRKLSAVTLSKPDVRRDEAERAVHVLSAIERMDASIDSLADLIRFGLGQPLALKPETVDLARLCQDVIAELAQGVGVRFDFAAEGDCRGRWDASRLEQAALLLFEEARSRSVESRVEVSARGADDEVFVEIAIPTSLREPGLRIHLGRELLHALGGRVDFRRDGDRSIFLLRLPRDPPF